MDELKTLVAGGDVALTDTVIKEFGEEVPIGVFLEQSRPLKLKVLAPAVPEPRLKPPSPPPPAPRGSGAPPLLAVSARPTMPSGPSAPPPLPGARQPDDDEEKPLGNIVWITVVTGVICLGCNFSLAGMLFPHASSAFALGVAVARTLSCTLICVGLRALRKNLRTRRATWISVMLGFILGILVYMKATLT